MYFSFSRASSRLGDARSCTGYLAGAPRVAAIVGYTADRRTGVFVRFDATRKRGSFAPARSNRYAHSIHTVVAATPGSKYARFNIIYQMADYTNRFLRLYVEIDCVAHIRDVIEQRIN